MLLSATLVAGLSLGAVLVATREVVVHSSLDRASRDLGAARDAFGAQVEQRADFASRETRLIAELPVFRSQMQDSRLAADAPTIDVLAGDYCRKLAAQFCVVSNPRGGWIGRAGATHEAESAPAIAAVIEKSRAKKPATDLVTLGGRLFLVVSEPATFAEELLGTFTAGYLLDDAVANELARVTRCDVSFVCADNRLCGTSLSADARSVLASRLESDIAPLGRVDASPELRSLGATSYVGGLYTLGAVEQPGTLEHARLVLLQDWSPAERAVTAMNRALLWVGVATFGVMVGGTLVFSHRMTRPFRMLAAVSHEIAGGSWTRRAPLDGPAEARLTATAFNHMTATLGHWHREAADQAQRLHESNVRFRAVTDSVHDAIISVSHRDEIVFWNQRAHDVFGYDESAALGRTLSGFIATSSRARYASETARLRAGGQTSGGTVELSVLRHDGTEVPVELSLSTWTSGEDVFLTAVFRDITERMKAAEMLRDREDQLRQAQKMEAVGQLAGGIAHDFNNLLTGILGYADLLLEDLPADHPSRADATGIRKAGRTAAALTRDLLAFSRKQVLQPRVLDLNGIVTGAESLLRPLVGEDIQIDVRLADDLPPVTVDRVQIEQVLLNLASNARDAMPGGGTLTISTAAGPAPDGPASERRPDGRLVILSVRDSGHGMTADVRARIFEPFFTTKEVGKGTGLGLATVYGIVQQSGGQVWVDTEPGEGATFHVALPAASAPASATEPEPEDGETTDRGSETILLVEDNESVRELIASALRRQGYGVLEARDGIEAIGLAAGRSDIGLLLTDVVMPHLGGRELAAELSARHGGRLKVLFMSGYTRGTGVPEDGPGTGFLQKPFTPLELGRAVRDLLDAPMIDAMSCEG
jgi:hypothetical protein